MLAVTCEEPMHMKLSFPLVPSEQGGGWWVVGEWEPHRVAECSALRGKADSECILGAAL